MAAQHSPSRHGRRRSVLVLALALTVVLVAAACGSDAPSADAEPTPTGAAEATPDPTPDPTPEPTADPTPEPTAEATPEPTAESTPEPAAPPTIAELLARDQPLNIAHAGGDQDGPHSTAYAFASAIAAGADMLEVDVQLSGDGVLIVQHDDTVDRTTETTGPVADRTLAELQALDNAYWFSPECWPCQDRPIEEYVYRGMRTGEVEPAAGSTPDDFRILTFRELAERWPELPIDIEIKGEFPAAIPVVEALASELDELGRTESVVVTSFDDDLIAAFHDLAPGVVTSPGVSELTAWVLADQPLAEHHLVLQVPPFFNGLEVVNAELIERAAEAELAVWVWPDDAATQENEAFYRELLELGVDGIIAGRPAAMTAAVCC